MSENSTNEKSKQTQNDEIDILNLLSILWKRRRHILVITFIFFFFALLYAFLATSWYRATVKITLMSTPKSNLLNQFSGLTGFDLGIVANYSEDRQLLYPEIVESDFILDRVLAKQFPLSKKSNPISLFEFWDMSIDSTELNWQHILYENAKKLLREKYLDVEVDSETGLLRLHLTVPKSPYLAAELANYITQQLDVYNKQFRRYKATDQRNFIEHSIKETKINLDRAEENLKKFSEENKDLGSPDQALQYERLLTEVNVQKTIYLELRKQLELAKIEEVKETETLDILQSAVVPIERFSPDRFFIILLFTVMGILISVIYVFLERFWLDNKDTIKKGFL